MLLISNLLSANTQNADFWLKLKSNQEVQWVYDLFSWVFHFQKISFFSYIFSNNFPMTVFYSVHMMNSHMKSHILPRICLEIGTQFANIGNSFVFLIMSTQQALIIKTFLTLVTFKLSYAIVTSIMWHQIRFLGSWIRTKLTFIFYIFVDMNMALQETVSLKRRITIFERAFYTENVLPIKCMHF